MNRDQNAKAVQTSSNPEGRITTAILISIAGILLANAGGAQSFFGPARYFQASDSPIRPALIPSDYFYLEDFEDQSVNVPGLSISVGGVLRNHSFSDSVDADDGAIDGSGLSGTSWLLSSGATSFSLTFNGTALGRLPTHVGVVWTDGGASLSPLITLKVFDAAGVSIGSQSWTMPSDGSDAGATAEDRFVGAFHAGGISRLVVSSSTANWEIDHVQYGAISPCLASIVSLSPSCGAALSVANPVLGAQVSVSVTQAEALRPVIVYLTPVSALPAFSSTCHPFSSKRTIALLAGTTDIAGSFQGNWIIPDEPSLCGASFILQALVRENGVQKAQRIGLSNGVGANVGL